MDRKSTSVMEGVREAICTSSSALSPVLPSLPAQREARTWVLRDHHGQPQGTPTVYPSCSGRREKRSHFSFERVLKDTLDLPCPYYRKWQMKLGLESINLDLTTTTKDEPTVPALLVCKREMTDAASQGKAH